MLTTFEISQELMLYLLQLVQALKFESPTSTNSNPTSPSSSALRHSRHHHAHHHSRQATPASPELPTLADFLIERSASNPVLGNHFYWYIQVEIQDPRTGGMFKEVKKRFEKRIAEVSVFPRRGRGTTANEVRIDD